jgi:clan AA aspartic protease (TIGR02281 family)
MIMTEHILHRSHHLKITTFSRVITLVSMTLALWLSPGYSAMYRCHDSSGTTVLTDNPAQLQNCSQLKTSILPVPDSRHNTAEQTPPHESPTTFPQPYPELIDTAISQPTNQESDPKKDIIIPLKKMGGSLIVQVMLNKERTAQLIVDTGASLTVLSTTIALDLGILGTTDNELLTVNTAGGSVQVNVNYLSSINIGNASAENIAVAIHDLPDIPEQIEGLLGMSFLKHFLITLDAEHARLILRPKTAS